MFNGSGRKDSIFHLEISHFLCNEIVSLTTYKKNRRDFYFTDEISGAKIIEKISSFDTLILVVEGMAEVVTDKGSYIIKAGKSLIIPANTFYKENGNGIFKMTSIRIMNGYKMESISNGSGKKELPV